MFNSTALINCKHRKCAKTVISSNEDDGSFWNLLSTKGDWSSLFEEDKEDKSSAEASKSIEKMHWRSAIEERIQSEMSASLSKSDRFKRAIESLNRLSGIFGLIIRDSIEISQPRLMVTDNRDQPPSADLICVQRKKCNDFHELFYNKHRWAGDAFCMLIQL